MQLHLVSARRLAHRLAEGRVSAQEQAAYLTAAALLLVFESYLFVVPPPATDKSQWYWAMYIYEGLAFVVLYAVGYFYCLKRCLVEPNRNFMIDFSCLFAPVAITTLVITWATFHAITKGYVALVEAFPSDAWHGVWFSAEFFDVLRFVAYVGSMAVIFLRVAHHMLYTSRLRVAANNAFHSDGSRAARENRR